MAKRKNRHPKPPRGPQKVPKPVLMDHSVPAPVQEMPVENALMASEEEHQS